MLVHGNLSHISVRLMLGGFPQKFHFIKAALRCLGLSS